MVARLARNHQFVAAIGQIGTEHFAEVFLGATGGRAVVVGQIEVRDTAVESGAHDLAGDLIVVFEAEVVPQAERNRRQLKATVAGGAVLHLGGLHRAIV